jgi:hypothetical protein
MLTIVKGIGAAIVLWVVLAFILNWIGQSILVPEWDQILVERGKPIYGRVVGKDAQDHQRVDYVYRVGGSEYFGSGQSGGGNANFADLALDASVLVYYDPENPSVSSLGSPDYDLKSLKLLIRAGAVAIPFWPALIFFLIYFAITRARRTEQLPQTGVAS